MENCSLNRAAERINAGAQIATVEPSQIEHVWEVLSRTPMDRRKEPEAGFTPVRGNPDFDPKNPDEQVAVMTRYALLDALVERGILNDSLKDESAKKHVFAAAATIPCE